MLIYFLQDFYDEIVDQIFKLREQREKCTVNTAARDAQIARINELQDFHQTAPCSLMVFPSDIMLAPFSRQFRAIKKRPFTSRHTDRDLLVRCNDCLSWSVH